MAKENKEDKANAEGEKPEGGDDAKPKSRFAFLFSKKVLMIAAPVLLLAIGGAVYFLVFAGGEEPAGEGPEAAAHGEGHGGGSGDGHGAGGGKAGAADAHHPVFFDVPDILVNVSSQGGKPVFLKLAVSLEVEGGTQEEIAQKLEPIMPRLIDQLQTYLRELRLEDLSGSAALFRLKEEMLRRINVAAAPVEVKGVLFREMIVQ
jgi:flagellar FliL protein